MSNSPTIPVRCPYCGTSFVINPDEETMTSAPPEGQLDPDALLTFRPVCPECQRRVTVRA